MSRRVKIYWPIEGIKVWQKEFFRGLSIFTEQVSLNYYAGLEQPCDEE